MTIAGSIIGSVGIFLFIIVAVIFVCSLDSSICSDCSNNDIRNTQCKDCEYYKTSLRYDYVTHWEKHNYFKKKGKTQNAK